MSPTTATESARNQFALQAGYLALGMVLLPGALMVAREAFLNAYGRYSLNIHTAPVVALVCALSFYGMCAWEVVGIARVGTAVVRRRSVHLRDVLAIIVGASVVGMPLFL